MQSLLTALKRSWLGLVLVGFVSGHVLGQATDSPIVFAAPDAITTTMVEAPSLGSSSGSSGGERPQWMKVEFHYAVAPKTGDFLDSVEFRIWVEGRDMFATDAGPDGIAIALTGSVTYINVATTKDAYGVFYIHPSTLARYSTKAGVSDFDRKFNIHIEAYVGGAKMDYFDKTKEQDPNWFQQLRVVPGLIYRQDQCAFIVSDSSRYPAIKPPSSGQ